MRDGWRLAGESVETLRFNDNGTNREIKIIFRAGTTAVDFGRGEIPAQGWAMPEGGLAFTLGNQHLYAALLWRDGQVDVALDEGEMEHAIVAPADGVVAALHYDAGDTVEAGAELLVLAGAS